MAPRRVPPPAEAGAGAGPSTAPRPSTLAGASTAAVDALLAGRRRKGGGGPVTGLTESAMRRLGGGGVRGLAPAHADAPLQEVCGAPAAVALDDERNTTAVASDAAAAADNVPSSPALGSPSPIMVSSDEEDWEEAAATASLFVGEEEGADEDGGRSATPAARAAARAAAAVARADAAALGRASALCALARGLALDAAADEPEVRAAALSLVPEAGFCVAGGVAADDGGLAGPSVADLAIFTSSWAGAMKLVPRSVAALQPDRPPALDPCTAGRGVAAAAGALGGAAAAAAGLLSAAAARAPAPEEAPALTVAALRALGVQARTVWALMEEVPPVAAARKAAAATRRAASAPGVGGCKKAAPAPKRRPSRQPGPAMGNAGGSGKVVDAGGGGEAVPAPKRARKGKGKGKGKAKMAAAEAEAPPAPPPPAECEAEEPPPTPPPPPFPPPRQLRGDAQLEAELAMAMEATAAAAAAAATSGGGPPPPRPQQPPAPPRGGSAWARSASGASRPPPSYGVAGVWVEAFCRTEGAAGSGRWVCVDPATGRADAPELAPTAARFSGGGGSSASAGTLHYPRIMALWRGGGRCVAARYGRGPGSGVAGCRPDPAAPASPRGAAAWWASTVATLRRMAEPAVRCVGVPPAPRPHAAPRGAGVAEAAEAAEEAAVVAAAAAAAAAVPATISGFKASAHYTLARFMPKTTAPRPGATPAGTHKGETFWAVADLEACHTETKWRRRGFVLRPGAVQAPAARIEESRFKGAYYGPWQVQGIEDGQPLPLDGAVPGRHPEYGSVEAPPLSVLPPGTVHLQGVGVAAAAKSLGVDAAPALVGFEQVAGGRWVPQTRGVVVLAAHAAAVRGAASQAAAIAIARAAARKRATAFTAWRRVLAEALSWVRVRAEHGGGGGGASAGEVDEGKVEGEEGEEAGAAAAAAAATAPLSIAGVDVEMI